MEPDEDDEEEGQDPQQPRYPAAGYASASNFQPGFGFGAPSRSWLKARGIIKQKFKGGSGTATGQSDPEPMDVEETKEIVPEEKRRRLLDRFDRPRIEEPGLEVQGLPPKPEKRLRTQHLDPQIREKWQNRMDVSEVIPEPAPPPKLTLKHLAELHDQEIAQDVSILLDSGVRLNAHKSVLAARSPFFRQMLSSEYIEMRMNEIELKGFEEATVRALLQYFYTGNLRTTGEFVLELLLLAQYCRVPGLKSLIEEYLGANIDEENVGALAHASTDCKAWQLREHCVKFLVNSEKKRKLVKEVPKDIALEVRERELLKGELKC